MDLIPANVEQTFKDCLFKEGEETNDFVEAHAVMMHVGFHPKRLEEKQKDIESMLLQLHDNFMQTKGGGWTFLNGCLTNKGDQWTGEHNTVDLLICLGLAIKKVEFSMDRIFWRSMPGGMPFFVVKDKDIVI